MTGKISFTASGTVGTNSKLELDATSSAGSRTLRFSIGGITVEDVWTQLRKIPGLGPPDLPHATLWDELIENSMTVTATVASDADGLRTGLSLLYEKPAQVFGPIPGLPPFLEVAELVLTTGGANGVSVRAKISSPLMSAAPPRLVGFPPPAPPQALPGPLRLNYLGLGQRVGPNPVVSGDDPLLAIFDGLKRDLGTSDPKIMLARLARDFYHPDRDWFVAADVRVREFTIQGLFNDPVIYGLRIKADDPVIVNGISTSPFFAGLLLEILYQKLGPGLGVYYGALTLPFNMRRLDIDGIILMLPGFSVWVYTNGDFRINVGWPLGPDSISASIGPLAGRAAFFFAKLRSSDVPGGVAAGGADFNPILQFGIALDLRLEVDCSAGPLSASLSVALSAMLQGVLAWTGSGKISGPPDHYWFAGQAGLVVLVQGSIDFCIIKATLAIRLEAQVTVAFETGCQTVITVSAEVSVELSVKVVFFTIHLSFDMEVNHSFTLGSGMLAARIDAPNATGLVFTPTAAVAGTDNGGGAPISATSASASAPMRQTPAAPATAAPAPAAADAPWTSRSGARLKQTVEPDAARAKIFSAILVEGRAGRPTTVAASFALLPTARFDAAGNASPTLIAALVLGRPANDGTSGFERLFAAMLGWLLLRLPPTGTASEWLDAAADALGHGSAPPSGLAFTGGRDEFVTAVAEGLAACVTLMLADGVASGDPADGALMPMPEGLTLTVDGGTATALGTHPVTTADVHGLNQGLGDLGIGPSSSPNGTHLGTDTTLGGLVMADWLLMTLRQLVGSISAPSPATDCMADLGTALSSCDFRQLAGFASRFLISGLRLTLDAVEQPLFAWTGQSLDASLGASTVARLDSSAPWVRGPAKATLPLGGAALRAPSYRWIGSGVPSAGEVAGCAASPLREVARRFALNRRRSLSGVAPHAALLELPAALLSSGPGVAGDLLALKVDRGGDGLAPGPAFVPALLVPLTINRVQCQGQGTAWLPGVYAVQGTDDATRELLDAVLAYAGGSTVRLLTAGTDGTLSALDSPVLLARTVPGMDGDPDHAGSADPAAFLRLLWEMCVDQGPGNFVAVPGLARIEAALFGAGPTATLDILILPSDAGDFRLPGWANRLAIGAGEGTVLACPMRDANTPVTSAAQAATPGTIGFELDIMPDAASTGAIEVAGLYHMVQFAFVTSDPPRWSVPIGPTGPANPWSFQQAVPAPTPSANPYDAVGETFRLWFRLLDVFGHVLPGVFPPPDPDPAKSGFAVVPGYADALIAPAEWPSVRMSHAFAKGDGTAAMLGVRLDYDADALPDYTRALHLARYDTIVAQLDDLHRRPGGEAMLATSLDGPSPPATEGLLPALLQFAQGLRDLLKASGPTSAVSRGITVGRAVPFADVATHAENVLPLSVSLVLTRPAALVDADTRTRLPAALSVSSLVLPMADPASSRNSLRGFAAGFEAAFSALADGTGLRLAQRIGLASSEAGDAPGSLWAVRSGTHGLDLSPGAAPRVTSYALRPLYNQLLTGFGLDGALHSGIDIDAVAATCLRAIDAALSPGRAVAMAGTWLDRLLAAKRRLAVAIPRGLARVLPDDPKGDPDAARAAMQAALMRGLGAAASMTSVVQARLVVGGAHTDMLIQGDLGAAAPDGGTAPSHYFLSPAPLRGDHITSLLSLSEPSALPSLATKLSWAPLVMRHEVELAESYEGFTPSSMLGFVLPWPPLDLGDAMLPVPLWVEPSRPKLVAHEAGEVPSAGADQGAKADPAAALKADIEAVLQWRYSVRLAVALVGQDELRIDPGFGAGAAAAAKEAAVPPALLALFQTALDFSGRLPGFGAALTALDAPAADTSGMKPFVEASEKLADAWEALTAPAPAASETTPAKLTLTLQRHPEIAGTSTAELRQPGTAAAPPTERSWPALEFGADPAARLEVAFDGENWVARHRLPEAAVLAPVSDLRLTWSPIPLAENISADFACQVVRNADLVTGRPTSPAFLFATPSMSFPSPLVPLLTSAGLPSILPTTPLAELLRVMLTTLAEVHGVSGPVLSVACTYRCDLVAGTGIALRLPVLLGTHVELPSPSEPAKLADMATELATEVADWLARQKPVRRAAALEFAVTLFGVPKLDAADAATAQQLPLIRLKRVTVLLPAEADPDAQAAAEAAFWPPKVQSPGAS